MRYLLFLLPILMGAGWLYPTPIQSRQARPAYYGEIHGGQVYLYRVGPKPYKPYDYRQLMGRPASTR